ncbi:hypothetical protein [Streptomyces sp. NPDC102476]|uniref:hypothetical protein n=1 Tax=Streptomyces sp. NPDC102476 TaxID=3366181 RepID=UPI003809FB2C
MTGKNTEPPSPLSAAGLALEAMAAKSPSAAGTALLRRIGQEARNGGRALAGVDLIQTYPPELLVPDRPLRHGTNAARLATLRDVAVFIPIILTWYSLWQAFNDFEHAPAGTTFLRTWSHGFGGTAVILVTALVALVVVLTCVLHWMQGADERSASCAELRQQVAEKLLLINAEVSLTVAGDASRLPSGKLLRLANEITAAAGVLAETMRTGTDRLARIFEPGPESGFTAALAKWSSSADELGAMGRSLTVPHALLRDFAAMRAQLTADERETRTALRDLVGELGEATETSRVSDLAHTRVAEVVVEGSRQLAIAMDKFLASSESLYGYMVTLQRVLDKLDPGWTPPPPDGMGMSNADFGPRPGGPGHDNGHPGGEPPTGTGGADPGRTRTEPSSDGSDGIPPTGRSGGVEGWYEREEE